MAILRPFLEKKVQKTDKTQEYKEAEELISLDQISQFQCIEDFSNLFFNFETYLVDENRKQVLDLNLDDVMTSFYLNIKIGGVPLWKIAIPQLLDAGQKGYSEAFNVLGLIYGRTESLEKGMEYFTKSAEMGCINGYFNASVSSELYPEQMFNWLLIAVQDKRIAKLEGIAVIYTRIAIMYHFGIGTKVNKDQAIKWYQLAAEEGGNIAMNNLAVLLVEKNQLEKAVELLKIAAMKKDNYITGLDKSLAMNYANRNLARLYEILPKLV